ncbi:MAG: fumarylacetoacetate hydrolase family protein [Gammaproteobacteria bacterium]|nr:fumarylacetoacetate hydrolase family protein [Gammaproteobacteria bacterium]
MRWISFRQEGVETFGYLNADDQIVCVGADSPYSTLKEALTAGALKELALQTAEKENVTLDDIEYLPTITNPDKILCVGLNYRDHQAETGRGGEDNPTIFVRFAAAQVGHLENMVRPFESRALDYEGEIAMIIGRHARRVAAEDWLDYVAGFSCYNDGSVRDYQRHTSQFTPGKNFTGTGGFGPWMMTPDEVGDLDEMEITTRLNGNVMQNAKSKQLVFGFADLLAYCSTFTDLMPGDVIVTGTPGGVGAARNPPIFMDEGDVIEITVEPIGKLRNNVIVG